MKKNMGSADRVIRVVIAALFIVLYVGGIITGTLGIVLIAFSLVFVVTSLSSTCPLYLPFGLNTMRHKKSPTQP